MERSERKNTKESMDYGKVGKEEYKGKYGLWKGRKGRILQKIWIESKNRKKKSIFIYFEYDNLNHLIIISLESLRLD